MQPEQTIPADRDLADATRETVMRYHLSWKHRDIDAVMALYHPEVEYNDFFQNRRMRLADLREYVEATMPKAPTSRWSTPTVSASTAIPPSSSTACG